MNEIEARRNEAISAYEMYYARDLVSDELTKFSALQAAMLAEIALQLAGINEKLESIDGDLEKVYVSTDENADLQDIATKLSRIGSIIMDK